ncbi:MAG: short-chain dehydrogenase, partial [Myxococcota bacterium]|nr:short-chain dehydrogenase [Myxococcota bacterium]
RQSNYLYGSAKGAFTLFLQGLRNRLFRDGVHVMTVRLGFVNTRMTFGMKTAIPIAEPDAVSHVVVKRGMAKANDIYVPGFWRLIMMVIRLIPEAIFKRLTL